ncbi:MAG TPA: histidine triad nucleotide-binding protein [Polyangiaceae bacterium]|jgi:histidine triad (HIT) family protein
MDTLPCALYPEAMEDCLFCKIVEKKIPAKIVYEDERSVAFSDINPQAPTHILVVPRAHIPTINDVGPAEEPLIGHLFKVASELAGVAGFGDRGYRTVINCGPEAGQSVYHVHLHLLGGRPMGWPPFPRA